jgi:DNA polymerase-3 subunit gamma/tau
LTSILQAESIDADEALIRRVARLADGSMRDALSLLDQLLSLGEDHLAAELVDEILPRAGDELMLELTSALAGSDAAAALSCTEQCLAAGLGFERFAVSLIDHLRCLMLLRVCGADTELIEVPAGLRQEMTSQCQQFDATAYVYMIALLEQLRRNVRFSTCGRALVDAAVVRLADAGKFSSIESLLAELGGVESGAAASDRSRQAAVAAAPKNGGTPSGSGKRGRPVANRQRASAKPVGKRTAQPSGPSGQADRPPPNSSQVQAALRDPLVQRAMEVFQGRPMDVKRIAGGR